MAKHLIKSDLTIRNAKPGESVRLNDGAGLYLLLKQNGSHWWRFDYSFAGKRKTLSLGVYPETGLKDARDKAEEARKVVAQGQDPSEQRKSNKARQILHYEEQRRISEGGLPLGCFEYVAREWFDKYSPTWAPTHSSKIIRRLEADVFPWIGKKPVSSIVAVEILEILRRVENRGALDTAHRIHQNCGQIFRYAIATGAAQRNPCPDLRGAMPPAKQTHYSAVTEPKEAAKLLKAIDHYQGAFVTKCALRLAPLVFVRPGELRQAEWSEIDFDKAEWNIPASKMKMREPHLIPLSRQTVAILREIQPLTGNGKYVFPGARSLARPMSENAILAALRSMGYSKDQMTGHGFRAMARTMLDEVLHIRPDFIEHQLAHAVKDPNGRAYNRTKYLPERVAMMQAWADYLDRLKGG